GPYRLSTRSTPAPWTASDRPRVRRSPARFTVRKDPGSEPQPTSSAIAEGTVLTRVTSPRAASSNSDRASSARTTVPPRHSGTNSSNTDRSNPIDVDARTLDSSNGVNAPEAQPTSDTALPCDRPTAFGIPVEPDV